MLPQEIIDKLFNVVTETYLPPVTEMKPSEIEALEGYDRVDYKIQFNKSLRIYVKPLERLVTNLLNNANKEKYMYNVDDLSIIERLKIYNSILIHSGYTKKQLANLLPKTEEEVDLLAKAFENGLKEATFMDNETRILEARDFLRSIGKDISSKKGKICLKKD